jgi:hypothetical protein
MFKKLICILCSLFFVSSCYAKSLDAHEDYKYKPSSLKQYFMSKNEFKYLLRTLNMRSLAGSTIDIYSLYNSQISSAIKSLKKKKYFK